MMHGMDHEEVDIDLGDMDEPQQTQPQQLQQLSWKMPLETVLEEEEDEEEDEISTQSDTRPLINERDPQQMNECLKVTFEDVIAEPESVRSGDRIWIWSNALFEVSRVWFYRIVTVLLAVPVSLIAGMLFGVLSCFHIWLLTPCVKITLLNTGWLQTLWSSMLDTFVLPFFQSAAGCFNSISVRQGQQ
ncbi:caveolin-2 [Alosa pseudoharengus]|uniref:caveolin-2 n=1 Tax=Alosa pseudoharengus TaxID=34774 RepID=UPI003F88919F